MLATFRLRLFLSLFPAVSKEPGSSTINAFPFVHQPRSRFNETVASSSWERILIPVFLLILAGQPLAFGQTDDFNDGNDTGWVRFGLDSAGLPPAAYTFPDDGFGGKAYRVSVAAPPVPDAGPARAFSYQTNLYDIFYAAVDVVAWDNGVNQAFGLLIRAGNIGLGKTDGYVLNYDPNQGAGDGANSRSMSSLVSLPTPWRPRI